MNLSNITILEIKNANYCCIISGINKSEVINLIQNINLTEKTGIFQKFIKTKIRSIFCRFTINLYGKVVKL